MKNTSKDLFVTTAIFNTRSKPKRNTSGARTRVAGLIFFFSILLSPSLSFSELFFLADNEMRSCLPLFAAWIGDTTAAAVLSVFVLEDKKEGFVVVVVEGRIK